MEERHQIELKLARILAKASKQIHQPNACDQIPVNNLTSRSRDGPTDEDSSIDDQSSHTASIQVEESYSDEMEDIEGGQVVDIADNIQCTMKQVEQLKDSMHNQNRKLHGIIRALGTALVGAAVGAGIGMGFGAIGDPVGMLAGGVIGGVAGVVGGGVAGIVHVGGVKATDIYHKVMNPEKSDKK